MYHALCCLLRFIALSPTNHTLPRFLLLIALYGAFSRLLCFSPLIALYPALFRTLPFNPLSFAYCALSRFAPVIFALSCFNSLYVAYLVLSRFSCFTLLSPALPHVNLFYCALPCFTRFKRVFHRFTLLMPHVSLYPLSCPILHSFHLLFFMPAFLFSPSLSFYAPLCQTSPRLQTYAQLALISYPYAALIRISLIRLCENSVSLIHVCRNCVFPFPVYLNLRFCTLCFLNMPLLQLPLSKSGFIHLRFRNLLFLICCRENLPCRICLCPIYFVSSQFHNFQQKQISCRLPNTSKWGGGGRSKHNLKKIDQNYAKLGIIHKFRKTWTCKSQTPPILQMVIDYENLFAPSCLKHFKMGGGGVGHLQI